MLSVTLRRLSSGPEMINHKISHRNYGNNTTYSTQYNMQKVISSLYSKKSSIFKETCTRLKLISLSSLKLTPIVKITPPSFNVSCKSKIINSNIWIFNYSEYSSSKLYWPIHSCSGGSGVCIHDSLTLRILSSSGTPSSWSF